MALGTLSQMISLTREEPDTALADQALELARALRNNFGLMHALMAVGVGRFRTEPSVAIPALDEAVDRSAKLSRSVTLNQAYLFRGLAHLRLGHTEQAAKNLSAGVSHAYVSGNVYYVAIMLTAAAGMLSRHDSQQTAGVRMLAVADRLRHQAGLVGAPHDVGTQRNITDRLRRTIGPTRFEQAWSLGRQTSLDEIVVLARAELNELA